MLFSRDRPFITYPDIIKLSEAGSSSFPSGHTIEAFAIAFAVFYLFKERMFVIIIFSWAILVAYTRMALGVHYPLDVLAGIFIGTSTSFITLKVYERLEWKIKKG
jgi:undecaprenyl-diphosphatase